MSDKARYYLEKSVPELEDLEKKGLFTKKEVNSIMRKWTDFEHRIMSRGSSPRDYLAYVKYEDNLEKLRKARYKRMKEAIDTSPSISDWSGQRRIMFVFERGVRKFPTSMELWANYLKYAKKNDSVKVVYKVYSTLLQHQPRNVDVWLSAAKYEYDTNKNVQSARNLFKRCLRFNGDELRPWLEFIKFEMNYLSKLLVRRKLFSLLTEKQQTADLEENENSGEGLGGETIALDSGVAEELAALPDFNASTLGSIENNPVLKGELIVTLYDVCVASLAKSSDRKLKIAQQILALVDQFEALDREYLAAHIIRDVLDETKPETVLLEVTLPIRYVDLDDEQFASALQQSVKLYQAWEAKTGTDIKRDYIGYLTDRYLSKAEGEQKKLLDALVKRLG